MIKNYNVIFVVFVKTKSNVLVLRQERFATHLAVGELLLLDFSDVVTASLGKHVFAVINFCREKYEYEMGGIFERSEEGSEEGVRGGRKIASKKK